MKKLIFVLLIAIQAQAQDFDFKCEPILVTINQYHINNSGLPTWYGSIKYSEDNNILRQMSIVTAIDGIIPPNLYRFDESFLIGEHVLTIALGVPSYNTTKELLEAAEKEDVLVTLYDCDGNRPISEDLTYQTDNNVFTLNISEIPSNVTRWNIYGTTTDADETTDIERITWQYNSDGRYSQSITVSGTQESWTYEDYDLSIFPNFPIPEGYFDTDPHLSFDTGICSYYQTVRNSNPGTYTHSWIEEEGSFGKWINPNFEGYYLKNLNTSDEYTWQISIYNEDGLITSYYNSASYSFDHFLYKVSREITNNNL